MTTADSTHEPKLVKSSAVVGSATMLSRVLGLLRDVVLANLIGANGNADAFFVAFKIPNFLRRLFAEGAFAQAFVPVLADTREHGGQTAVKRWWTALPGCWGHPAGADTHYRDGLARSGHDFCPRLSPRSCQAGADGGSDQADFSLPVADFSDGFCRRYSQQLPAVCRTGTYPHIAEPEPDCCCTLVRSRV